MLSSAGVVSFQNTFPTSTERKAKIWLGKVGHPTGTITTVGNEPDYITSPTAFARDLFEAFGYINSGVYPYANGANLNLNVTAGNILGDGINFVNSKVNPNIIAISAGTAVSFMYRTQLGGSTGAVTTVTPGFYDNGGVVTAVGGGNGASVLQYFWVIPGLGYIMTYGQTVYTTFNNAIAAVGKETPVIYPNLIGNAILVGVLVLNKLATSLNNTNQAQFFRTDKIGQVIGASSGTVGSSTKLNQSIAAQILPTATKTYLVGSNLSFPSTVLQAGSRIKFEWDLTKTAAGTATSTIDFVVGTAGTTGDATILSFTKPSGTAAIDTAWCTLTIVVRNIGASAIITGTLNISASSVNKGFLQNQETYVQTVISSPFDSTTATNMGVCYTSGAAEVITVNFVTANGYFQQDKSL